jgi:hypothetical protein
LHTLCLAAGIESVDFNNSHRYTKAHSGRDSE